MRSTNFLRYDPGVRAEEAAERLRKARSALTASNAGLEDVLNAVLPPREENGLVYFVSREPASQIDVLKLGHQLQDSLEQRQARMTGMCPIRLNVYLELFDELIRQIGLDCIERGLLLKRMKDQILLEIRQKQLLYEQAMSYAQTKLQIPEATETVCRLNQLEAENLVLKRQQADLKQKLEATEKGLQERREKDKKRGDDETVFLQKHVEQLKTQLKGFLQNQ